MSVVFVPWIIWGFRTWEYSREYSQMMGGVGFHSCSRAFLEWRFTTSRRQRLGMGDVGRMFGSLKSHSVYFGRWRRLPGHCVRCFSLVFVTVLHWGWSFSVGFLLNQRVRERSVLSHSLIQAHLREATFLHATDVSWPARPLKRPQWWCLTVVSCGLFYSGRAALFVAWSSHGMFSLNGSHFWLEDAFWILCILSAQRLATTKNGGRDTCVVDNHTMDRSWSGTWISLWVKARVFRRLWT